MKCFITFMFHKCSTGGHCRKIMIEYLLHLTACISKSFRKIMELNVKLCIEKSCIELSPTAHQSFRMNRNISPFPLSLFPSFFFSPFFLLSLAKHNAKNGKILPGQKGVLERPRLGQFCISQMLRAATGKMC